MSSQSKNPPATAPELRRRVYTCIDKLSDRATFTQASSELNFIAGTLPDDSHSLSSFLSCILSIDASTKPSVRIHCLNLLSLLAKTHNFSLCPHLPKTIVPALLRRLRDGDSAVRAAVSGAAGALSPLGLFFLLGPLIGSVLTEQETNAQIGACLCLRAAVDGADDVSGADEAELRRVMPRLLKMVRVDGYKAKAALLGVIVSVVGVNGGNVVNGRDGLVGNVVSCAVEMLGCDDWAARKAAAEVLEAVAVTAERESAKEVMGFVVSSLESRRFDKVKATREIMNRALEAWKKVPGGPEEDLPLSRSNSSFSKDNGNVVGNSPSVSRRSSFAGMETPKQKKMMSKTRSSLYDYPNASNSSSTSTSTIGLQTPQRKKTMSKSKSYLSDDSTITDSSSLSRSFHDVSFETSQSKKLTSKDRYSLPDDFSSTVSKNKSPSNGNHKNSLDWRPEIALPPAPPVKVVSEDYTRSHCESETMEVNFYKQTSEKRMQKAGARRSGSRVVPFIEEKEPDRSVVERRTNEEVGEKNADIQDLSQIRNQLFQIERQQSDLLDLLMRFMGNSQSRIDSLETRVSGLERTLDEISYDLAMQRGRIQGNASAVTTCCPSTEFLSPKFWRKVEGRPSTSKSSNSGSVPNKDGNIEELKMDEHRLHEKNSENANKNVRGIGQNAQRGRASLAPEALMQLRSHLA